MNDFHSEEEAINKGNKPKTDKNEFSLKEKIASLPTKPGIYKYSDSAGTIIYVGKAINLRNRVKSYFQYGRPVDAKTKVLTQKIVDVEIIVTDSEAEALILENTLIKKYKPRYNIMLKDDKTYPYVRVTNEDYPRMFVTRRVIRDGSKYYGPFTEGGQLKALMKTIRSLFMLRSCDYKINAESIATNKYKLCLDYHIKKCDGPCEGLISKELYNQNVKHAVRALNGKTEDIRKHLKTEMGRLSEDMLFEEAAVVRNKYLQLNEYLSKQKIVTTELIDRDIFGFARVDSDACVLVFKVRDGKLLGKRHFIITKVLDQPDDRILQKAAEKWYFETGFVP
ncbi:MAG: excinuclease ABC subunit UvrC [Candidatus Kapabacteria bacterium]|jgi:excinuclease ABC subunit C|nr:excinuclease ABC subunit UvrC [Candidatus Kapabacteria bacterium]